MPAKQQGAKKDFPAFAEYEAAAPLVYLDSAASCLMPNAVIDAITDTYRRGSGGADAGLYPLAEEALVQYDTARETVRNFLHAATTDEILFTAGATAGLNFIAATYGARHVQAGDEVVVSELEHHANLLPWQRLCRSRGARLITLPITRTGDLDAATLKLVLSTRTKIVAVTHVSNVLGTITPVRALATLAHEAGAVLVVDGAQAGAHLPIDVQELGADFYVLAGHKCYGPTGIGVVYGRATLLADLPPWQVGGRMVEAVTSQGATFAAPPRRFEAGTPNVAGAVGLAAALTYVRATIEKTLTSEARLLAHAQTRLSAIPGVTIIGAPVKQVGVLSFTLAGAHPHDVAALLGAVGIAVRAGLHCAEPLAAALGLATGTVRISFGRYNANSDIDRLAAALPNVQKTLGC